MIRAAIILLAILTGSAAAAERTALFFTASWCPTCRLNKPFVAEAKAAGYQIKFCDIDDAKAKALADSLEITTIPAYAIVDRDAERTTIKNVNRGSMTGPEFRRYLSKWEVPKKEKQ